MMMLAIYTAQWEWQARRREERGIAPAPSPKTVDTGTGAGLDKSFYLLSAASLGGAVASFVFFVGRSFAMTDFGFDATALTTAGANPAAPWCCRSVAGGLAIGPVGA